jgi:hypothetical protein
MKTTTLTDQQTLVGQWQKKFEQQWEPFNIGDESWGKIFKVLPSMKDHESISRENGQNVLHPKSYGLGFTLSEEEAQQGWTTTLENQCKVLFKSFLRNIEEDAVAVVEQHRESKEISEKFICFERQAPEVSVIFNAVEQILHFKISARYSFGCANPNAVFASTGDFSSERKAA